MTNKTVAKTTINYDDSSYGGADKSISIYQDDARIFHQDGYLYNEVKKIEHCKLSNQHALVQAELESGESAFLLFSASAKSGLRFQFQKTAAKSMPLTEMITDFDEGSLQAKVIEEENALNIHFGSIIIRLQKDPFSLEIQNDGQAQFTSERYDLAGTPLVGQLGFREQASANETVCQPYISWKLASDEKLFGLGEKWNRVEKTSSRATIFASDTCGSNSNDLSYKSIPYLLSTKNYGFFLHSSFRSYWELGSFSYVSGSLLSEDNHLDLFFFFAQGMKNLISAYTDITGRPAKIPDWALGLWMSRCQYRNQSEAEAAMDGLRERKIPADVIHLDPLWMKTHYYFKIGVDACDFEKHNENFPDLPSLFRKWKNNGFKTCLWVNPYLPEGTGIYNEAKEKNYLLKNSEGGVARLSHGEPVGMIDFSFQEARDWWKESLKQVLSEGAAVLKPDYGDRVSENAVFHDGRSGKELHNMCLFWFTETCYQACQEVHGYGLVWRRAGYIGSQRYPGTWAGDTRSTWEEMAASLRGGLSAGFNGDAFWSSDIGGFTGEEPSPELYIRWSQLGLLSSLSRFHGTNSPREPWYFGDKAVEVVRYYSRLRYALIPYLKKTAEDAYNKGWPLMRHMFLEFPEEIVTAHIDDQYMLGSELLIAPVMHPGQRKRLVYFPQGEWKNFYNEKETITGGAYCEVDAALEQIPLYKKAGSVIPMDEDEKQFLE